MITGPMGYRDVADILYDRIMAGELRPGDRVPSETDLRQTYGVARGTASRALHALAEEGLIEVRHGYPSRVRIPPERTEVRVTRYSTLEVRRPTRQERVDLGLERGVSVVAVTNGAKTTVYAADRHVFVST